MQTSDLSTVNPLAYSLSREELNALCRELHVPAYRATQLWQWLYVKRVADWSQMTNLPSALRSELATRLSLHPFAAIDEAGRPGETRKLLLELRDGERIEMVLIPAPGRRTVCISSQAGCSFGCTFCASGVDGLERNLEAGEMVAQVLEAWNLYGDRPTNVVFMGTGEPFDNYDEVLRSIRILNDPDGMGIGARRLTVSTCGLVPGIARLAEENLQVELSVSLHAPTDELRDALMPVNQLYPLEALIPACHDYWKQTNRIITYEYTLIGGINDSDDQARELVRLLSRQTCRFNLIPLSPIHEFDGHAPAEERVEAFAAVLRAAGINTTIRISKGLALDAACGQLRWSHGKE